MNSHPFFFSAGGPWAPPPPQPHPVNPHSLYSYFSTLPSFPPHHHNYHQTLPPSSHFPIPNPNPNPTFFAPNRFSTPELDPPSPPRPPPQNPSLRLERINRAVETARADLIAAGEGVSAWKAVQCAIRMMEVDSWSDLGFRMQQVPALHRLMLTEGKINAFIHCYVGVRRIATLYDLEVAICKNEAVERFEELGLGPLLRNPLLGHYFSVKRDATEVCKITCEDIILLLSEFMDTCDYTCVGVEEFVDFVAEKCRVSSREDLGIRLHSLGVYISAIQFAKNSESAALKKSVELINQKADSRCTKGPPPEMQQDKHIMTSTHKRFCGKYIRFDSDDEDNDENKDHVRSNQGNISSQSVGIPDREETGDNVDVFPSQSKDPLGQVNLLSLSERSFDRMNSDEELVVSPSQSKGQLPSLKMQQDKGFNTIYFHDDESLDVSPLQSQGQLPLLKMDRDKGLNIISHRDESFVSVTNQFCGKHTRFDSPASSENEDDNGNLQDEEDCDSDQVTCNLLESGGRSDCVRSCPYPSVMEEIQRLRLDQLSSDSDSEKHKRKHKKTTNSRKKKRKSEDLAITVYVPPKLRKTESSVIDEDCNSDPDTYSLVSFVSQSGERSDRVSSCPYPSLMEEIQRLGLDQLSSNSGNQKQKEIIHPVKKKRKSEDLAIAIYVPTKSCTKERVDQVALPMDNGMQDNSVRNMNKVESRPTVDWRTAPRYNFACANGFSTQPLILNPRSYVQQTRDDSYGRFFGQTNQMIPITYTPQYGSNSFGKRDRLSTCTPDATQAKETGRLGELAAFKYFVDKFGKSAVKWLNESWETRLPYDIIIEHEGGREFVEVKATRNPTKDWFEMSVRQMQFAVEQGEAFSIAQVILSNNDTATVRVYKNLEKLLMKHNNPELQDQDCKLKSVVMVLEPQKEFTILSLNSRNNDDLCTLENGFNTVG